MNHSRDNIQSNFSWERLGKARIAICEHSLAERERSLLYVEGVAVRNIPLHPQARALCLSSFFFACAGDQQGVLPPWEDPASCISILQGPHSQGTLALGLGNPPDLRICSSKY